MSEDRTKKAARRRAAYLADPEKSKTQNGAWARANPDRVAAIDRRYYEAHQAQVVAYSRGYRAANPDRVSETNKAWHAANREKRASDDRSKLLRKYGLTVEEYGRLLDSQNGLCAGCEVKTGNRIDHDHKTGRVRGILCNACNTALGFAHDDPQVLQGLIKYLERKP